MTTKSHRDLFRRTSVSALCCLLALSCEPRGEGEEGEGEGEEGEGGCGLFVCEPEQICTFDDQDQVCACPRAFRTCGLADICTVDIRDDPLHCGACDNTCQTGVCLTDPEPFTFFEQGHCACTTSTDCGAGKFCYIDRCVYSQGVGDGIYGAYIQITSEALQENQTSGFDQTELRFCAGALDPTSARVLCAHRGRPVATPVIGEVEETGLLPEAHITGLFCATPETPLFDCTFAGGRGSCPGGRYATLDCQ